MGITAIKMFKNFRTSQYLPNFQNLHGQFPNFQNLHIKLEFVDFSLIGPVSTQFTNYFEISLKNSCVRRKHRIKILKTIRPRYCNYLGRMVFRFPICNTGPVKKFFEKKSKKKKK